MKITKRQLRQIIREEKARLHENRTDTEQKEMQLADEIVDLLIKQGAVPFGGKYDAAVYQAALDYVRDSVVPALGDLVDVIEKVYE